MMTDGCCGLNVEDTNYAPIMKPDQEKGNLILTASLETNYSRKKKKSWVQTPWL